MDAVATSDARKVRVRRQSVFYTARVLALVSMSALALALAQLTTGDYWSVLKLNLFLLCLMLWKWATSLATLACRRMGLSLDGTFVEAIERGNSIAPATELIEKSLVIKRSKASIFIVPVCSTLLCLVCFGPSLFIYPDLSLSMAASGFRIFLFASLATAAIYSWLNLRKPAVKINAGGIAYCDALGFSSRFIAWTKVASCEVVSTRNVFGEVINKCLVLKDFSHKKLISMRFDSGSKEEGVAQAGQVTERIRSELARGSGLTTEATKFC
jgi:hypothetical protein